jgi:hypothetical protein
VAGPVRGAAVKASDGRAISRFVGASFVMKWQLRRIWVSRNLICHSQASQGSAVLVSRVGLRQVLAGSGEFGPDEARQLRLVAVRLAMIRCGMTSRGSYGLLWWAVTSPDQQTARQLRRANARSGGANRGEHGEPCRVKPRRARRGSCGASGLGWAGRDRSRWRYGLAGSGWAVATGLG